MGESHGILSEVAERIISNLEQMALPETAHAERALMVDEVTGVLETMLTTLGFVRLVKPNE